MSQLHLNADTQNMAKEGYMCFWNNAVKKSKNPDKPEGGEDYYQNPNSDKYKLVNEAFEEIEPPKEGYDIFNILSWMQLMVWNLAKEDFGTVCLPYLEEKREFSINMVHNMMFVGMFQITYEKIYEEDVRVRAGQQVGVEGELGGTTRARSPRRSRGTLCWKDAGGGKE